MQYETHKDTDKVKPPTMVRVKHPIPFHTYLSMEYRRAHFEWNMQREDMAEDGTIITILLLRMIERGEKDIFLRHECHTLTFW